MNIEMDIVIIGHLAKDVIELDGKSYTSLGGSVYYGGIAGSHMGLKVAIITRLREKDFPLLEIFKKNGIKYYFHPSNETSGLRNIYSSSNVENRNYEPLGFAGLFEIQEIPEINTKFFIIGPIISGEIDKKLLDYLYNKYPDNLCLDIQGFIRAIEDNRIIYRNLSDKEKRQILSKVKVLKLDQNEAAVLTNQSDIDQASKELSELGTSEILITHQKGITVNVNGEIFMAPWKNKSSEGRTGRGDTAFISYLGSRITKDPKESLKFAAALTSLKLEAPGPFNLPLYQVESLIKKEY
ncbi:MAG: hypothetical protein ACFE91_06705 [Promethearchaeota archaeon]